MQASGVRAARERYAAELPALRELASELDVDRALGNGFLQVRFRKLAAVPAVVLRLPFLVMLSLQNNLIERLPDELGELTQLRQLLVASNRLRALPASLARLGRLETLDVSANVLEELDACVCELRMLRELNVSGNRLRALPELHTAELRALHAADNLLESLPAALLARSAHLEVLDVSRNALTAIPESDSAYASLRVLLCVENPIAELPCLDGRALRKLHADGSVLVRVDAAVLGSASLQELRLEFCRLSDASFARVSAEHARAGSALRSVALTGNALTDVGALLRQHRSIRTLSAAHNALPSCADVLASLGATLVELDVSGNALEVFDARGLVQLAVLRARSNRLRRVDLSGCLATLRVLDLGNNALDDASWPVGWRTEAGTGGDGGDCDAAGGAQCAALEELLLDGNALTDVPAPLLGSPCLRKLSVRSNCVRVLSESFAAATRLESLDVSSNQLGDLPAVLAACVHLKELFAADNAIERVDASLSTLTKLEELHLQFNRLTSSETSLDGVRALPALRWLYVHNNALTCVPVCLYARERQARALILLYLSNNCGLHAFPEWFVPDAFPRLNRLNLVGTAVSEVGAWAARLGDKLLPAE